MGWNWFRIIFESVEYLTPVLESFMMEVHPKQCTQLPVFRFEKWDEKSILSSVTYATKNIQITRRLSPTANNGHLPINAIISAFLRFFR